MDNAKSVDDSIKEYMEKNNDSITIEELIENDEKNDRITFTISDEQKENAKKNNDYIEVLAIWKKEKHTEQIMKVILSVVLGIILLVQIICINIVIFKIGQGSMIFDEWTIRFFITGVFAEIVALVKIIVNNLYPQSGSKDFMEFINELYSKK